MPRRSHTYLAHVVPGLEPVAREEMRETLGAVDVVRSLERFDERTGMLVFRTDAPPAELLDLRTVEDVFVRAAWKEGIAHSRAGLSPVRTAVLRDPEVEAAVEVALRVLPKRRSKVSFRVIARKSGEHAFRRVDLQHAVERALGERFPAWRLVEDDAVLEVWVTLIGPLFVAGIRLSDNTMRGRTYRVESLPAALKPTVAAAMVRLSDPQEDDVVLDPMCGSGTILIERALAGRYALLLGGDSSADAVNAARANVGPRYKPIEIQQWDARRLPLEDRAVTRLICNLPFGKQIGTPEDNRTLYPALLGEWLRVLAPGGAMVLLTSERALMRRVLERAAGLSIMRQVPALVRGLQATIYVLRKDDR